MPTPPEQGRSVLDEKALLVPNGQPHRGDRHPFDVAVPVIDENRSTSTMICRPAYIRIDRKRVHKGYTSGWQEKGHL